MDFLNLVGEYFDAIVQFLNLLYDFLATLLNKKD